MNRLPTELVQLVFCKLAEFKDVLSAACTCRYWRKVFMSLDNDLQKFVTTGGNSDNNIYYHNLNAGVWYTRAFLEYAAVNSPRTRIPQVDGDDRLWSTSRRRSNSRDNVNPHICINTRLNRRYNPRTDGMMVLRDDCLVDVTTGEIQVEKQQVVGVKSTDTGFIVEDGKDAIKYPADQTPSHESLFEIDPLNRYLTVVGMPLFYSCSSIRRVVREDGGDDALSVAMVVQHPFQESLFAVNHQYVSVMSINGGRVSVYDLYTHGRRDAGGGEFVPRGDLYCTNTQLVHIDQCSGVVSACNLQRSETWNHLFQICDFEHYSAELVHQVPRYWVFGLCRRSDDDTEFKEKGDGLAIFDILEQVVVYHYGSSLWVIDENMNVCKAPILEEKLASVSNVA